MEKKIAERFIINMFINDFYSIKKQRMQLKDIS